MTTFYLVHPALGNSTTVFGRTYKYLGVSVPVTDLDDYLQLKSNGWVDAALVQEPLDTATGAAKAAAAVGLQAYKTVTVDVNVQYGAKPGDDVTSLLNNLLSQTLAPGVALDVIFSVPGAYYLDGATQSGTALTYAYKGAVLIPAVAWDGGQACALRIRGALPLTSGDPFTGDASGGVTFVTTNNQAGRYMFAAVPYSSKFGWQWTGVMPVFENVKFLHPADPQGGSVDAACCQRAAFNRVVCSQGVLSSAVFPTGTAEAIVLPATFNNGDVTLRDVQVRGWGYGIRLSEHCMLDNVDVSYCGAAFTFGSNPSGHMNWFGYVDVEECKDVFLVQGTGVSYVINGNLDVEDVATGSAFYPMALANIVNSSSGLLGQLSVACTPSGSLALRGAGQNNVSMDIKNSSFLHSFSHPVDTFARLQGGAQPGGTAPGLSWPTLDAWKVGFGSFAIGAGGGMTNANNGGSACYLLAREAQYGGRSRRVQATFTLPSANYDYSLLGQWQVAGSNAVSARVNNGNITLGLGGPPNGGIVKTLTGAVAGGGTYTMALDLHISAGVLVRVDLWLNGVLQYTHACTATQQLGPAGSAPYLGDGLWINDNGSFVTSTTSFVVMPLSPPPANLTSGTATLVAGAVTVANTSVTSSSLIRLTRQAAGGTVGHMSLTLSTGTSFTITSSSNTDISTVFWELVKS